jgi:LEA14-like dessication related protein
MKAAITIPEFLLAQSRLGLALLMLLAACTALGPRIEAPRVTAIAVRLDRLEQATAYLAITVELANPNANDIDVTGFDAAVAIEGEPVVTAMLTTPVRVPAASTAKAELAARTGVDTVLRAAAAAIRRGAGSPPDRTPSLRYTIEGVAIVNGTLRVPFARTGDLGHPSK